MEANELRIGNIVFVNRPRHHEKYIVIESIGCDLINMEFREYHLSELQSIPLTEEWMRKFGFITLDCEIDYIEWGLDDNKNGADFAIVSDGLDKQLPLYFCYDLGQYEIKKEIKYIHQLQNLYFALTGTELTINS